MTKVPPPISLLPNHHKQPPNTSVAIATITNVTKHPHCHSDEDTDFADLSSVFPELPSMFLVKGSSRGGGGGGGDCNGGGGGGGGKAVALSFFLNESQMSKEVAGKAKRIVVACGGLVPLGGG